MHKLYSHWITKKILAGAVNIIASLLHMLNSTTAASKDDKVGNSSMGNEAHAVCLHIGKGSHDRSVHRRLISKHRCLCLRLQKPKFSLINTKTKTETAAFYKCMK